MALIKCSECEKEISDKANMCPNCGCPINDIKSRRNGGFGVNFWLIMCIIACLIISLIEIFNLLDIDRNNIRIGNFNFNIIGYLAILLCFSYISIMKNKNKISYYIMLGINAVILLYNIFNVTVPITFKSGMSILYIICVIINSLITTLVIKKHLNNDRFLVKNNKILITIFVLVLIILIILESTLKINFSQTNTRDETVNQVRIVNDYINIRSENSLDSDIIGKAYKDEIYTILNEEVNENEWLEIETTNGVRGYIYALASYVEILRIPNEEENEDTNEIEEDNKEKPNVNNNSNGNESSKPNNTKPNTNVNNKPNSNKPSEEDNNSSSTVDNPNKEDNNSSNIADNPNKEDSNSSNIADKPSEEDKKEEIIDATLEYYCTIGNLTKYNTCSGYEYLDQIAKYSCPEGYRLNQSTNKCDFIKKPDVQPSKQPYCYSGTLVYVEGQYICNGSNGNSAAIYKNGCPEGYKLINGGTVNGVYVSAFCTHTLNNTSKKADNDCPDGYKGVSEDGRCMKSFTGLKAEVKYSCPNGYTLKQDKCYKN